jgi:hypothetical protein
MKGDIIQTTFLFASSISNCFWVRVFNWITEERFRFGNIKFLNKCDLIILLYLLAPGYMHTKLHTTHLNIGLSRDLVFPSEYFCFFILNKTESCKFVLVST